MIQGGDPNGDGTAAPGKPSKVSLPTTVLPKTNCLTPEE